MAIVAVGLGLFFAFAALLNWEPFFKLRTMHWVEDRWGRPRARKVIATIGMLIIAVGAMLAFGILPLD